MDKSDLLLYAKEYATTQDLYELLGVTSDTPKEDIHRAWRKRSLKYHPDKAGANFDASKWELFERARDVLSDAPAREVYDSQRSAALLREQQRRAMDAKKRSMVEDLEARERGGGDAKRPRNGNGPATSEAERQRLVEAGKRRMEARQKLMRDAEMRERERERERKREQARVRLQEALAANENTTTAPAPTPTPSKKTPDHKKNSDSDANAKPPASTNPQGDDDYERQIADIERRLEEARVRKAAAKKDKKKKKTGKDDGREEPQATHTPDTDNPNPRISAEAPPAIPKAPAAEARAPGSMSSTLARLVAAQAAKDARKAAEAAAAAAAAGTTVE
ncbi:DnaJ-domain-containing protein [Hypoxylon fragiforme]|uniref:DnaJ-domain-containing protein n=1 Tax=Hypoxylon fragiforme TaxID=63214 RepID=UPI0020C67596|nr:DnaJ-domain-containing protein [Hypoxylon fragiforme]KAI2612741.1 DnaJ-domain-containing protein [Hypoxylon fragiforme]